jgi:hypothetical protein
MDTPWGVIIVGKHCMALHKTSCIAYGNPGSIETFRCDDLQRARYSPTGFGKITSFTI